MTDEVTRPTIGAQILTERTLMRCARLGALLFVALAALAIAPLPAAAVPYTSMVVFGDSLSDSGNNSIVIGNNSAQIVTGNTYVPAQPYSSGVYSNGPVWASDVAATLGVMVAPSLAGGTNFAFGGAATGTPGPGPNGFPFSLITQVSQHLLASGGVSSPTSLYVIEGGINNARGALEAIAGGAHSGSTAMATAAAYAADVGAMVDALQAATAQHIIVWNTPNLGTAPAILAGGSAIAAAATDVAESMNAALSARLSGEVGVSIFDIFSFGTSLSNNPSAFGFPMRPMLVVLPPPIPIAASMSIGTAFITPLLRTGRLLTSSSCWHRPLPFQSQCRSGAARIGPRVRRPSRLAAT